MGKRVHRNDEPNLSEVKGDCVREVRGQKPEPGASFNPPELKATRCEEAKRDHRDRIVEILITLRGIAYCLLISEVHEGNCNSPPSLVPLRYQLSIQLDFLSHQRTRSKSLDLSINLINV